ncbi:MAG: hypothetical protein JJE22_20115, partial [Bacteroidia bacterium]|nr:hypothetical protein [Bacteroidia bacterium]
MPSLTLSLMEIIVLMLGAIILGITIHFFIVSRRSLNNSSDHSNKISKSLDEWKLKYFNEIEVRGKELFDLKQRLENSEEDNTINTIEAEEMRSENKKLRVEIESLRNSPPVAAVSAAATGEKPDYIDQLRQAQSSLMDHNEKINQLLGQIEIVKETEEKQQEIQRNNEQLVIQINELKSLLSQKENEVNNIRQKEHLTNEMTSMLDNAYNEFNVLQGKIQKLESDLSSTKMVNMDYEDMKEAHYKLGREFEDIKL